MVHVMVIVCYISLDLDRFSSYFTANFPGWQPRARGQSVIGVIGQAKVEHGQTFQIGVQDLYCPVNSQLCKVQLIGSILVNV